MNYFPVYLADEMEVSKFDGNLHSTFRIIAPILSPMQMEIGTARIGETDTVVVVNQIGLTRIGCARVTPRNASGRFVAIRKLIPVMVDTLVTVALAAPQRVRNSAPLARALVCLAMIVVTSRRTTNAILTSLRNLARNIAMFWLRTFSPEYTRHGFVPGHRFAGGAS